MAGNNPTLYAYVHDPNSWVDPFGLRGLWKLTNEGSSKRRVIGNRVYYQHKTTGLWWSVDTAGHGGSAFKVFKETEGGTLEWYRGTDKYGDFIDPNKKHKGKKGKKFVEDSYMIDNIKEYIKLADSDDLEDNNRTKTEQLSSEVIFEIIHNYPERKAWLVHNKHIPIDVLKLLCKDKKSDVRFTVAMKNKNDRYVFEILMNDPDFSIRMAVVRNKRIPIDLLKKMVNDKDDEISKEAMRILKLRDSAL